MPWKRSVKNPLEFAENIINTIRESFVVLDQDLRVVTANRSFYNVFKVKPDETVGRLLYDLGNKQWDIPGLRGLLEDILSKKEAFEDFEVACNFQGIGHKIILLNACQIYREDIDINMILLTVEDITVRKQAEEALRNSEEYFRSITENASDIILVVDKKGVITYASPSVERILGYKPDELIGKSSLDLIVPADYQRAVYDFGKAVLAKGALVPNAFRVRHKDGSERVLEGVGKDLYKNPSVAGFVMNVRDVTDNRKAEASLQESELLFRKLFENHAAVKLIIDPDTGKIIDANKAAALFYGWSSEQLKQMKIQDINTLSPEDVKEETEKVRAGNKIHFEFRHRRADGSIRDVEVFSSKIEVNKRDLLHSITYDITDRKQAEAELKESEERYRTFIDATQDMVFIKDEQFRYLIINQALSAFFGKDSKDVIGKTDFELMPVEAAENCRDSDLKALKTQGIVVTLETAGEVILETTKFQVPLKDKKIGLGGIIRDMTDKKRAEEERKKLEAQFNQAQKMEAIGTLAGGIAHDFNNLLMTMQGNTSMMMEDLDPSHPHNEYLKGIQGQIRSAANLTKQLLGFAREGRYDVKPTDINEIVEKTAFMFGRTKKEIRLQREYGEDLWPVEADANQMEQLLVNLFVNAWQAMPGGGDLFLETKKVILDEDYIEPYMTVPGQYVKISVTDTGVGMDEKTMQRIFEPFFTTKERGKGTGLGLSMVYGIVKGHKGFINVYSEPGHGTTFNIYLPASGKGVSPEISISSDIIRGTGTVLLVDDEATVLKVSQRMLERLGYKVIAAQSGKTAIDLYGEKKEEIDLVLLDMIMPDISGEKVFQILRDLNPAVKVILLSGYSLEGQAQKIIEQGCNGFLQKPVTLSELSQKIHEVLSMKTGE